MYENKIELKKNVKKRKKNIYGHIYIHTICWGMYFCMKKSTSLYIDFEIKGANFFFFFYHSILYNIKKKENRYFSIFLLNVKNICIKISIFNC